MSHAMTEGRSLRAPTSITGMRRRGRHRGSDCDGRSVIPRHASLGIRFGTPASSCMGVFRRVRRSNIVSAENLGPSTIGCNRLMFSIGSTCFCGRNNCRFTGRFCTSTCGTTTRVMNNRRCVLSTIVRTSRHGQTVSRTLNRSICRCRLRIICVPIIRGRVL